MIYGAKQISHMQLLGKVLSNAQTNKDNTIAWITLDHEMIQQHNVAVEDTLSFINHLLILNNIKVACMFRKEGAQIRVSFRSTGVGIDVGAIAQSLGGGGHNHSAATLVEGELEEVIPMVITKVEQVV